MGIGMRWSLALAGLMGVAAAGAQTLARPGWVGSGLMPETWWRHAVMYRVDAAPLPTLTELPSLQAFGIDALVLTDAAMEPVAETEKAAPVVDPVTGIVTPVESPLTVDDLLFECGRLRIRVLVPLDVSGGGDAAGEAKVLALARSWLYRGAGGFVVMGLEKLPRTGGSDGSDVTAGPVKLHKKPVSVAEPLVVTDLRRLVAGSPGERVLVGADASGAGMASLQLEMVSLGAAPEKNAAIAQKLAAVSAMTAPRALVTLEDGAAPETMTPIAATLLLATDQPAVLDSSMLSVAMLLKVFPPLAKPVIPDNPVKAVAPAAPAPPENVYGAYHEYVRKPDNTAAEKRKKAAAEKAQKDAEDIAFATFPVQPMYQAMSQTPEGLVAFYHRVIQLHRSNATLREGTLFALHTLPGSGLAWAALHAGSAPIVVLCNPTDGSVKFDVSADLKKLRMNRSSSRTILHTGAASAMEDDDAIGVAAQGVYVGELARGYSYK